jgi:addiction module HigA family antidote
MDTQAVPCGLPLMHPGELLREEVIPALGRPVSEIAGLLGISRQALHAILTERAAITPLMALKLGKLCGNGPDLWMNLQVRYDLARLGEAKRGEIAAVPTLNAA